jgi:CelD/BcsL family acetyltransferase involved in cellulose biosynthesis
MTLLEAAARRMDGAAPAAGARTPAASPFRVEVISDIDAASRAWLSLEVSGVVTPYQTLGWQRAAIATLDRDARPRLVVVRDRSGGVAALLPFVVRSGRGLTVASFAGGKHANYNMGLFAPDAIAALTAEAMRGVLRDAAAEADIDLFALRNQPAVWAGRPNPMALLPHQPAANGAWRADLIPDADAFVAKLMSSESRKKLRHKERKLAEIGPVAYIEALTPEEARRLLDAFLAQKQARFAAMGVANPFAAEEALAFLEAAAVRPLSGGPPAPVALHGLTVGGRPAAVFGGVAHGGRFSGMFTSFDTAPEIARYSPGDLLLLYLVRRMCARGLSGFDLGVGDAGYKSDYCPIREEIFDSFLPVTAKGRVAAAAFSAAYRVKAAAAARSGRLKPLMRSLLSFGRR